MDSTSDHFGFIAAYPQAAIRRGSGFDWNIPGVPLLGGSYAPPGSPEDVAFLTQLVPALAARYCINPIEVYATGLSGGGRMASQLGCDAPTTFAAIAPVAGLRYPSPCPTSRAVPVIAFHGTADPVDPYGGNGQPYWTYSVPVAASRWATHNGCASAPTPSFAGAANPASTPVERGYTPSFFLGCRDGSAVELYTILGEGHEWPGGPSLPASVTRVLGPQSDAVDANTTMWTFFSAHPLTPEP